MFWCTQPGAWPLLVSRDAAVEYSTAAQVYSASSRHKLRHRIGVYILIYTSMYNIIRKTKRLIIITFGTDVNHKVMLWCHVISVTSRHKLVLLCVMESACVCLGYLVGAPIKFYRCTIRLMVYSSVSSRHDISSDIGQETIY